MIQKKYSNSQIRKLQKEENIPYDLLLLADETIEAIDKYIYNSDIYVLKLNEKISALYVLQSLNNCTVEIKNIAVHENLQGQGIGMFLLQDAIHKAKNKEFKWLIIGTGDASLKQISLYQKAGFEIFDRKENFFIKNYPTPIYENGKQLKDMIMLKQKLK